jgi:hypothetical protein
LCERHSKYVQRHELSPDVEARACRLIASRLAQEYPERFQLVTVDGGLALAAEGGRIPLEPDDNLARTTPPPLERLALLLQEDFAIVSTVGSEDWVSFLHLCSPSHWRAEDKIGRSFFSVHEPIPGFAKINAVAANLVDSMVRRGPFVRFVWGVESDFRLNHHPDPPPGWDPDEWQGRIFASSSFWVRTERQVVWGMPEVSAALFAIKVGFVGSDVVLRDPRLKDPLISALESMSAESRDYKGLTRDWNRLMAILKA